MIFLRRVIYHFVVLLIFTIIFNEINKKTLGIVLITAIFLTLVHDFWNNLLDNLIRKIKHIKNA